LDNILQIELDAVELCRIKRGQHVLARLLATSQPSCTVIGCYTEQRWRTAADAAAFLSNAVSIDTAASTDKRTLSSVCVTSGRLLIVAQSDLNQQMW